MKKSLINRAVVGVILASTACLGTNFLLGQTTAPATAPAAPMSQPAILASVNGQDIDSAKFNQLMLGIAGMRVLEQVVDLIVAEQACASAGINVNAKEFEVNIKAELDRALSDLATQGVPKESREAVLQTMLQKQGVTVPEFQMGLRRAACLRALAKGKVTLTDENLQDAYDAEYGSKVRGRLVVVRSAVDAKGVTDAVKEGKDLTEYCTSHNLQLQNVTITEKAKGDSIKALKDVAFTMKVKELSAALPQPGGNWILFYLDGKDAAQTNIKFESVKEELKVKYTEQGERQWAANHLQYLRKIANIKINDPTLSLQYADLINRINAAATQAATQNATQPTTGAATNPK